MIELMTGALAAPATTSCGPFGPGLSVGMSDSGLQTVMEFTV